MIAITTSSSMSVKPRSPRDDVFEDISVEGRAIPVPGRLPAANPFCTSILGIPAHRADSLSEFFLLLWVTA
jgi:hypothetical protein